MCAGSRRPPARVTRSTGGSTRASSAGSAARLTPYRPSRPKRHLASRSYERYRTEAAPHCVQPATMAKTVASQILSKVATGIEGFDEISLGGLPRNRTTLVMGGPGTGKSVFALQTLVG